MNVTFQKKDWQFRDVISEDELNRIEDGIEEGITKAEQAKQTADNAQATADEANQKAEQAQQTAQQAEQTAQQAAQTADQAAQTATQTANDLASHQAETTQDDSGVHGIVSTAAITYYIDEANGNDNNDGLSAATAFKTWGKARSKIPRIINHNLTIRIIGNYSGDIVLKSIVIGGGPIGIGVLNIIGDTTTPENHIVSSLQLFGVFGQVNVSRLQISGLCTVNRCLGISLYYCNLRNPGGRGVDIYKSSAVRVQNCNFGTDVVQDAIWASESKVYSSDNSGSATRYGLHATEGATIAKDSTQPTGATANEYAVSGGVIR